MFVIHAVTMWVAAVSFSKVFIRLESEFYTIIS